MDTDPLGFVISEPGIGVEQGLYVSHIVQGSAAAKEGTLAVGDRILSVSISITMRDETHHIYKYLATKRCM